MVEKHGRQQKNVIIGIQVNIMQSLVAICTGKHCPYSPSPIFFRNAPRNATVAIRNDGIIFLFYKHLTNWLTQR